MVINSLYVADSPEKGRGVFTDRFIEAETLVEIASVIVIPANQRVLIDDTILYDYYFNWSEENDTTAIALGYASIYNHSYDPNCKYLTYYEDKKIEIIALRDIEAGEELTFNYNWDPKDRTPLWFKTIE